MTRGIGAPGFGREERTPWRSEVIDTRHVAAFLGLAIGDGEHRRHRHDAGRQAGS
jgi:hypothetical protein